MTTLAPPCRAGARRRSKTLLPWAASVVGAFILAAQPASGQTTLTFRGCVTAVHPSPLAWSGGYAVFQTVDFNNLQVISGSYSGSQITVHHPIVSGGADVEPTVPQLRSSLFHVGAPLRIEAISENSPILGSIYRATTAATLDPSLTCEVVVPTISPWGMVALTLLVLAAAMFAMKRRLHSRRNAAL